MDFGLVLSVVLIVVAYLFGTKLVSLFYKTKAEESAKEGEALKQQTAVIETEVKVLKDKLNQPTKDLTPQEIEDFWNEDKK